ncbi:MAG: hypothetical protein GKR89_22280 [Candidatus Latescibacteria bacterium]|nr:hypothetical protein [Candidatus Latescibacterota bacterium]
MKIVWAISLSLAAITAQAADKTEQRRNFEGLEKRLDAMRPGTPKFEQGIQGLITRYNTGFMNQDLEAILACLDQSFFKITMETSRYPLDPINWRPDLFHRGENEVKEWLETYLKVSVPFKNEITFSQVSYTGNTGIAVTTETGQRGPLTWDNMTNVWLIGKVADKWKIQGIFVGSMAPLVGHTSDSSMPIAD